MARSMLLSAALVMLPLLASGMWAPQIGDRWQWQLSDVLNVPADLVASSYNVTIYDIDGFDNPASTVAALHAKGLKAICYISCGTAENWRSDYNQFTASDLGAAVDGWAGERWVNIKSQNVRNIMAARFAMCAAKGFDAIEPDNIDEYENNPGFTFTSADQINYNTFLANTAHSLGLSIALKNDGDQAAQLASVFDFAINEQCYQYNECSQLQPFLNAKKAVFDVEYTNAYSSSKFLSKVCPANAKIAGLNTILKTLDLTQTRTPCPNN